MGNVHAYFFIKQAIPRTLLLYYIRNSRNQKIKKKFKLIGEDGLFRRGRHHFIKQTISKKRYSQVRYSQVLPFGSVPRSVDLGGS